MVIASLCEHGESKYGNSMLSSVSPDMFENIEE